MSEGLSRPRLLGLLALCAGLAVALGACGSDSHGSPPKRVAPPPAPTPTPAPPPTACLPSASLSVLVQGANVLSYVPKGAWDGSTTGVSLIQVEGSGVASAVIPTAAVVNSCSSNSATGETVCTANGTAVYLINGSSLTGTLHSAGSGTLRFSGGSCTNCGVVINATTNQALIALSTAKGAGFQFLDLGDNSFEAAFQSKTSPREVSEDVAIDPVRHLLLSATEASTYEVGDITDTSSPKLFENNTSANASLRGEYDSSAEDCTTGVALATDEFTGNLYLADLSQATFTPGSPGTWTAPQQRQTFPEFANLSAGTNAVSVAGDSHIAVVNGEFGGNLFGAVVLPSSSGSGGAVPGVSDYIACSIPNAPDGPWNTGDDPHTTTAYVSPNSGDAIALVANANPPTFVAMIDMTKLLNPSIVPRVKHGFASAHTCSASVDLVSAGIVKFIAVP